MPLSTSEKYLVTEYVYPVQLGSSEIVTQDELGNSATVLDVEEYCSCANREVVNLENAAVNIDNSSDVIFGPVTQFNVSGNVTIYQNGSKPAEALADKTIIIPEQLSSFKSTNGAKLARFEKSESEEQDTKNLNKNKIFIKICLAILLSLITVIGIIVILLFDGKQISGEEEHISNDDGGTDSLGDHKIFDRTKWNGRPPLSYRNVTDPLSMVVIKHTGGGTCSSFTVCAGKLQTIQSHCVATGSADIDYNFLIGGDGNIYVGRGWDVQAEQRDDIIDIVFMGSFTFDPLTPAMTEAAKLLILSGVDQGKLTENYGVVCHNQISTTESPGLNVIKEVQTWPHYDPNSYLDRFLVRCVKKHIGTNLTNWWNINFKDKINSRYRTCLKYMSLIVLICLSAIVTYVILVSKYNYVVGDGSSGDNLGSYKIYYKEDWGGEEARSENPLPHPTSLVIFSHSATTPCYSFTSCSKQVRDFQKWHLAANNNDIGYNFVVGGDANVYVGRGWDVKNFHRQLSIGINFIGNFNNDTLSSSMIECVKLLLQRGIELNKISEDYVLIGHNQSTPKVPLSPGSNIYEEIKYWPHFSNKTFY